MAKTKTPTRSLRRAAGEPVRRLRDKGLLIRGPSGEADAHAAPSEHAWRECVLAGICPICNRGPYVVLAGHTVKKHAIDRFELRERAGFCYSDTICDPAHSERARERALADPQFRERMARMREAEKSGTHRLSPAGKTEL